MAGMHNLQTISLLIAFKDDLEFIRDMLSTITSKRLSDVICELYPATASALVEHNAGPDGNGLVHSFKLLDDYFADDDPRYPAQLANLHFVFYTRAYEEGSVIVDAESIIKNILPQTLAQGRLGVKFVDEVNMDWF